MNILCYFFHVHWREYYLHLFKQLFIHEARLPIQRFNVNTTHDNSHIVHKHIVTLLMHKKKGSKK